MSTGLIGACTPSTFSPSIFGTRILDIKATVVTNYTVNVNEAFRYTQPTVEASNLTFCNVTVSYTHPGQDDNIKVDAWLPIGSWNHRLQAVGGGGWVAGRNFQSFGAMKGAIADGYATITTDAGLGTASDASTWALLSPGNVNMYNLQNLASVALNDQALLGKALIKDFYGKGPDFSYWNGCSQGGRQGLMMAQRFPEAYDGIAAAAPAIHWTELFPSIVWPQQVMNNLKRFPQRCQFEAITAAAIAACDGTDGVVDGIIGDAAECLATFNPFQMVGKSYECAEVGTINVTSEAATIIQATWQGMTTKDGKTTFPGLFPGAALVSDDKAAFGQTGLLDTACSSNGTCVGSPSILGEQWLQFFIAKDPDWDFTNVTHEQFDILVQTSRQVYSSIIGTEEADLSRFRDAGGKMVTFHGLADNIIPTRNSERYYNTVAKLTPDVQDFYRYFEAPGLGHCSGGPSQSPTSLFSQLRAWVENGTAPGHTPIKVKAKDGEIHNRILCAYPQKPKLKTCDNPAAEICWSCV